VITTEQEAREFLRGCFESYNVRDWDRFFDKYVWETCLFFNGDGLHTGRETMIRFWENYYKTKPKHSWNLQCLCESRSPSNTRPDFIFEMRPFLECNSKATVLLKCADFYKIRDGRFVVSCTPRHGG
jgi:hypothetical protein